ncbi:MAG TPA: rhodanese-like domain-containing protein [Ktedonobacterales bacterium]|jgi:rhodanese-related sulfurtransferase|nr:rhodanese-like domain-containing protein [Ktedonobacterales bacterium]
MATNTLRDHLLTLFEQTRDDVAAFAASRHDHDRASHDLIALIGFWMEYNVERIGCFARGETPPRDVDFDALTRAALTENAYRSWAGAIAYTDAAFDHFIATVAASPESLLLANNSYGDDPGGPCWEEIRANGFTWPLQEMEKLYLASGDTERAATLRTELTRESGEEQPIVCELMEPGAVHARRGDLLVIDVRGASEYAAGHLSGARHISLAALADTLDDLPRDQQIITYCNMQHPGHSRGEQAAALLRERGYYAAALVGGYPAWRQQGLPVERANQG